MGNLSAMYDDDHFNYQREPPCSRNHVPPELVTNLELQLEKAQQMLREKNEDHSRLKSAYESMSNRYLDLTSRMTDAELDEVRAREKN